MNSVTWKEVLDFWFDPNHIELHFSVDEDFDEKIRHKFLPTWQAASEGLLAHWRVNVRGRLAEIIVLDQFSRNLWRGDLRSFTQDKMALALAQEVVNHPDYYQLSDGEKRYILLPFMHSESLDLHKWAEGYFKDLGDENFLYFEKLHREVLEEFGRYPYQNEEWSRGSSPAEVAYLREKDGKYYA